MGYCVPLGIPHTVLLGRVWPDPDDREQGYWTAHDVATAISYRAYEAQRCHSCGSHPDDWPTDEREDPPFLAKATRCRGCTAVGIEKKEIPDSADMTGITVGLHPYDPDQEYIDALDDEDRAERIREAERAELLNQPRPKGMLEA